MSLARCLEIADEMIAEIEAEEDAAAQQPPVFVEFAGFNIPIDHPSEPMLVVFTNGSWSVAYDGDTEWMSDGAPGQQPGRQLYPAQGDPRRPYPSHARLRERAGRRSAERPSTMTDTSKEALYGSLLPASDSLTHHSTLREANITRQAEWDTGSQMTLSYSGNELAGEVGEAIEAALAAVDEESRAALADELGDVVICCDLLAMRYDITLDMPLWQAAHAGSSDALILLGALIDMAMDTGRACNVVKKLDRELLGMKGSRSTPTDLAGHLHDILSSASDVAAMSGLVLADCVAAKFNKTSEKVGLNTRYTPDVA